MIMRNSYTASNQIINNTVPQLIQNQFNFFQWGLVPIISNMNNINNMNNMTIKNNMNDMNKMIVFILKQKHSKKKKDELVQ